MVVNGTRHQFSLFQYYPHIARRFRALSYIRRLESLRCADSGKQFELGSLKTEFKPSLLLNLALSMRAAIQARVLLMAQNQLAKLESGASKDRQFPFCSVTHRTTELISGA